MYCEPAVEAFLLRQSYNPETNKEPQVEETALRDRGAQPKNRRVVRWIKGGLRVPLIGLPSLAMAGIIFQLVATKIDQRKLDRAQALQMELTNLSSNSTRRVIEGSDHGSVITNERHAQETSEEILKVIEAVRTGRPLEQ